MAKKATGGAGAARGAHLASGYISLNVKYGSAMRQIADDFGVVNKRAKETGDSITKGLVEKADAAKEKVKQLGTEYEAQRTKVTALRAEVERLAAVQAAAQKAEAVTAAAHRADIERQKRAKQEAVSLQIELNKLLEAPMRDQSALKAWNDKWAASTARRKKELEEVAAAEKKSTSLRSSNTPERLAAETAVRQQLSAEVKKGMEIYSQYGKAVEDSTRKQDLAKTSAAALAAQQGTFGQRFIASMKQIGTHGGSVFRSTFGKEMRVAREESSHHARNIASGIFMGMTPGVLGAAGVGIAFGKAFSAGFNREETMNTVKLRLQALGTSAADVQTIMDQSLKSVEGTQYALDEAFTAASTAMTAGVKSSDMVQYLGNIANAAALTGEAYDVVANSINRVQMQGTVSIENIEPLIRKNLPILKWLREYYAKDFPNTTQADITDMISKKMIPADVMQKVLSANLNDSMRAITRQTTRGALADLMTQVGKVSQSILAPFMKDWPTLINTVGDKVKRFAEYIKPGMAVAAVWIKRTWADLWPKVTAVLGKAVDFMSGLWDKFGPRVMEAIGWLWAKWKELWPKLVEVADGFFKWFQEVWDTVSPLVKKFVDKMLETWNKMWPQLQEKFAPFVNAFKRLWPEIQPAIKLLAGLFAWLALEFVKHLPAFAQFGTNIVNWIATALNWMRTEAWPWMQKAWKNVTTWIGDAIDKIVEWKDAVVNGFNDIKSKIAPVWTWLEEKWKWFNSLSIPSAIAWVIDRFDGGSGVGYNLTGSSSPMASGAGSNVPMPARLNDSGHVSSGPQSRHVAGLLLKMFPGIEGSIGGSYLPRTEGGPSAPGTHDAGLAIDIPIGSSAEQRAMGDSIEKFLQANAKQLGIVYTIWKDVGRQTGMDPSRPAGTTFGSGGHQDHIDVQFDGKSFGAAFAQATQRNVLPSNDLEAMFAKAGIDPAMFPMLRGFAKAEGNNASGVPTLGFTDSQAGGSLQGHVNALARQLVNRAPVAGAFPANGTPQEQAAWMATVVNQNGIQSDWQGNAQPPRSEYIDRIVQGMGRRRVDVSAFGGQQNLNVTKPLAPGGVVPQPPGPVVGPKVSESQQPWDGGGGQFDTPGAGQAPGGGGGSWGDEGRGFLGTIGHGLESWAEALLRVGQAQYDDLIDDPSGMKKPGKILDSLRGIADRYYVPPLVSWAQPNADYYKNLYPKSNGGNMLPDGATPEGTSKDPIHTQDDKVAENTEPPPDPGAAVADTPKVDDQHSGTGAAPGPASPDIAAPDTSSIDAGGSYSDTYGTNGIQSALLGEAMPIGDVIARGLFDDQFQGTKFSNPVQWPMAKSASALLKFIGGIFPNPDQILNAAAMGGIPGIDPGAVANIGKPGKPATPKQIRDMDERVRDVNEKVAKAKAEKDSMVGKPQYTAEDRQKAADALTEAERERTNVLLDQQELMGKGGTGAVPQGLMSLLMGSQMLHSGFNLGANLLGGNGSAAVGDLLGFVPQPFGNLVTGTPGAAPAGGAAQALIPGGGSTLSGAASMIPDAASLAPGQANTPGGTNIDLSINQTVDTPGQTAAADAARRAQNTQLQSPLLQTRSMP